MIFLSLALDVIIAILKIIRTHSIMDSTAVSGAAGSGSIPDGCISSNMIYMHSRIAYIRLIISGIITECYSKTNSKLF